MCDNVNADEDFQMEEIPFEEESLQTRLECIRGYFNLVPLSEDVTRTEIEVAEKYASTIYEARQKLRQQEKEIDNLKTQLLWYKTGALDR